VLHSNIFGRYNADSMIVIHDREEASDRDALSSATHEMDVGSERWLSLQLAAAPALSEASWARVARIIATQSQPLQDQIDRPSSLLVLRPLIEGRFGSLPAADQRQGLARRERRSSAG
jgi:hypothetical protein